MRLAIWLYGLASIATGAMDLTWGSFDPAEEPIQAFGDHVPGQRPFAYLVAVLLVVGGAAILQKRSRRFGAILLAVAYAIFTIFWVPRLINAPAILGYHPAVYIGVLGGLCQQLILFAAALLLIGSRPVLIRAIYGLSAIIFGLTHLTGIAATARLVPNWLPPGQDFWVVLTGIAFLLAGISILVRIADVWAARLLGLMLLVFSALALSPQIMRFTHDQPAWGVNVYNLAAVGAVWLYAEWRAKAWPKGR